MQQHGLGSSSGFNMNMVKVNVTHGPVWQTCGRRFNRFLLNMFKTQVDMVTFSETFISLSWKELQMSNSNGALRSLSGRGAFWFLGKMASCF